MEKGEENYKREEKNPHFLVLRGFGQCM